MVPTPNKETESDYEPWENYYENISDDEYDERHLFESESAFDGNIYDGRQYESDDNLYPEEDSTL